MDPATAFHREPDGSSPMRIDYKHFPLWLLYGFKEGFDKALGSDVIIVEHRKVFCRRSDALRGNSGLRG